VIRLDEPPAEILAVEHGGLIGAGAETKDKTGED
jgi:hypothetical protein